MTHKTALSWIITGIGMAIIVIFFCIVDSSFSDQMTKDEIKISIQNYQISIWIGWIIMTVSAIYRQWKSKNYVLFLIDYVIVITAFIGLGYFLGKGQELGLWTFSNSFTQGIEFNVIRNIFLICFMTGFIQAAIWLFSSKWHRK
ncbi:hypothetical protein [Psychroflexus montanilacus]|uniref:hypothetical protein n=1 Tax=Psychroflexus montanilacus TaxID=2873598 RepID=UPI001CCD5B74|nr:hypothetical protein [Psychroflexus montanilacus]MBZ9652459.1 hypothetical protein [Psychroflexus montanilacus]